MARDSMWQPKDSNPHLLLITREISKDLGPFQVRKLIFLMKFLFEFLLQVFAFERVQISIVCHPHVNNKRNINMSLTISSKASFLFYFWHILKSYSEVMQVWKFPTVVLQQKKYLDFYTSSEQYQNSVLDCFN